MTSPKEEMQRMEADALARERDGEHYLAYLVWDDLEQEAARFGMQDESRRYHQRANQALAKSPR